MNKLDPIDTFLSDEIKELLSTEDPKIIAKENTPKPKDLSKEGMDYWAKVNTTFINSYEKGEVISNYNSVSEFDHLSVFHSLTRIFFEIIREEMLKQQIETSALKDCFDVINTSFKILSNQYEKELKFNSPEPTNPIESLDVNLLISGLHGYINSYLQRKSAE